MSLPISTAAAALGVARVATRAVRGSMDAALDFAGILGESAESPVSESTQPLASESPEVSAAEDSLQSLLSDWMRRFGFRGDEAVEVSLDPISERVRVELADASPEATTALARLETGLNADASVRRSVVDVLNRLPGRQFRNQV